MRSLLSTMMFTLILFACGKRDHGKGKQLTSTTVQANDLEFQLLPDPMKIDFDQYIEKLMDGSILDNYDAYDVWKQEMAIRGDEVYQRLFEDLDKTEGLLKSPDKLADYLDIDLEVWLYPYLTSASKKTIQSSFKLKREIRYLMILSAINWYIVAQEEGDLDNLEEQLYSFEEPSASANSANTDEGKEKDKEKDIENEDINKEIDGSLYPNLDNSYVESEVLDPSEFSAKIFFQYALMVSGSTKIAEEIGLDETIDILTRSETFRVMVSEQEDKEERSLTVIVDAGIPVFPGEAPTLMMQLSQEIKVKKSSDKSPSLGLLADEDEGDEAGGEEGGGEEPSDWGYSAYRYITTPIRAPWNAVKFGAGMVGSGVNGLYRAGAEVYEGTAFVGEKAFNAAKAIGWAPFAAAGLGVAAYASYKAWSDRRAEASAQREEEDLQRRQVEMERDNTRREAKQQEQDAKEQRQQENEERKRQKQEQKSEAQQAQQERAESVKQSRLADSANAGSQQEAFSNSANDFSRAQSSNQGQAQPLAAPRPAPPDPPEPQELTNLKKQMQAPDPSGGVTKQGLIDSAAISPNKEPDLDSYHKGQLQKKMGDEVSKPDSKMSKMRNNIRKAAALERATSAFRPPNKTTTTGDKAASSPSKTSTNPQVAGLAGLVNSAVDKNKETDRRIKNKSVKKDARISKAMANWSAASDKNVKKTQRGVSVAEKCKNCAKKSRMANNAKKAKAFREKKGKKSLKQAKSIKNRTIKKKKRKRRAKASKNTVKAKPKPKKKQKPKPKKKKKKV